MKAFYNRAPLSENQRANLSPGKVKAEGRLKALLTRTLPALTDALDKVWNKAQENPADDKAFVRAVYLAEAIIYVSYALDDNELKLKADKLVKALVELKSNDGKLEVAQDCDYTPYIYLARCMYEYIDATGDKEMLILLDGFLKYEYKNLPTNPLKGKACAIAEENIYTALKLYNITGQKYLLELCKRIKEQMLDWTNIFATFPNIQPMSKSMSLTRLKEGLDSEKSDLNGADHPFFASYYHQSLGENVAMGLKAPGVVSLFKSGFKEQSGFKSGWEKLCKYHGTAAGMFTCDEHLNGNNPSHGIMTSAVCETMNSLETLLDCGNFGDDIADILEKIAYNLLPAALGEDGKSAQKLQQTNQISITPKGHEYYSSESEANVFSYDCEREGLLEIIGAIGKFVSSLWQATADGGLSAVSYAPCTVNHVIDSTAVRLSVKGDYPYGEQTEIEVDVKKPLEFPLYLRIPFWAENPMIQLPNGEIMTVRSGETACIRQKWISGSTVKLTLPKRTRISKWSRKSAAVEYGALLMALPLEYSKQDKLSDGIKTTEYELKSRKLYAIKEDEIMKPIADDSLSENNVPLKLLVKVYEIKDWELEYNDLGAIPIAPKCSKQNEATVEFVPYAYTKLRIAQFPTAQTEDKNA